MSKDRRKLIHIHSKIYDKQPTPQSLEYGELGINFKKGKEFVSLRNDEDKVVRISSDEQLITWGEKKEVIPYSGTVENIHLDTNRSNIEIKFNQVVASNTAKHDNVNGAKDIDGQDVNPSSDGGITNGAGFAIDTSAFALLGGNPTFSSVTVTEKTILEGETTIGGEKLDITSDDVNINGKNVTISGETVTLYGLDIDMGLYDA